MDITPLSKAVDTIFFRGGGGKKEEEGGSVEGREEKVVVSVRASISEAKEKVDEEDEEEDAAAATALFVAPASAPAPAVSSSVCDDIGEEGSDPSQSDRNDSPEISLCDVSTPRDFPTPPPPPAPPTPVSTPLVFALLLLCCAVWLYLSGSDAACSLEERAGRPRPSRTSGILRVPAAEARARSQGDV